MGHFPLVGKCSKPPRALREKRPMGQHTQGQGNVGNIREKVLHMAEIGAQEMTTTSQGIVDGYREDDSLQWRWD